MLNNKLIKRNHFEFQFLKYRIKNYIYESLELLSKHKLLLVFIIFLFAQGVKSFPMIGIPFFEIINPTSTIKLKLFSVFSIILFSISLVNAQSEFITGGKLSVYFNTFYISEKASRIIDFLLLIISLNFIWIAIFTGLFLINTITYKSNNLISLYCLYVSFIFGYLVLLLDNLYKNKKMIIPLLLNLICIGYVSVFMISILNYFISFFSIIFSYLCLINLKPNEVGQIKEKPLVLNNNPFLQKVKIFFALQLSTLRENKASFILRVGFCLLTNVVTVYMIKAQPLTIDHLTFLEIVVSFNCLIMSSLFSFFQVDRNKLKLFHSIYPYHRFIKHVKDAFIIYLYFLVSNSPSIFYLLTHDIKPPRTIIFMNLIIVFFFLLNRLAYKFSLRLSMIFSFLSSFLLAFAQYYFLGDFLDN